MEIYQLLLLFILSLSSLSVMLPLIHFSSVFLRWAAKILVVALCLSVCFSFIAEVCAPQPWTPSYNPTVYTADTGSCYHSAGCGSLWHSSNEKSLCEAVLANYQRCSRCDPPRYSEEQRARIISSRESTAPALDEFLFSCEYIMSGIIFFLLMKGIVALNLEEKLKSSNHQYTAAILDHAFILFILFYLPALVSVFILLSTASSAAVLIGIPLFGCFVWIKNLFFSNRKPTIIHSQIAPNQSSEPPLPIPPPRKPVAQSVVPAHNDTSSYRVCHFMWTRSIIFCEHVQKNPSLQCVTYTWTAFFYSITKHIRNQDLVNEIYAQFKPIAESFIKDGENKAMSLHDIQSAYWRFRGILNASEIDPRTQVGMSELWKITAQQAFPNVQLPESVEISFSYNVQLLVNHALTLYGLKPPVETVYCMEAANGMAVRVPESKLEAWQAAQEVKGSSPTVQQRQLLKDRMLQDIYGSEHSST